MRRNVARACRALQTRAALLCGDRPDLAVLAAHGVAAVIALAAAVAYTARVEPRIADLV